MARTPTLSEMVSAIKRIDPDESGKRDNVHCHFYEKEDGNWGAEWAQRILEPSIFMWDDARELFIQRTMTAEEQSQCLTAMMLANET